MSSAGFIVFRSLSAERSSRHPEGPANTGGGRGDDCDASSNHAGESYKRWLQTEAELLSQGWGENGRPPSCPSATPAEVIRALPIGHEVV